MHLKVICKIVTAVSVAVIPAIINYFVKWRYKKKLKELKLRKNKFDNSYYHCIFWTMENTKCREHMLNSIECGNNCSVTYLETIIRLLSSSKLSIALCMYHLTLKQITDALIEANNRGVNVRIITDAITFKMQHSKLKFLQKKLGFDVRVPPNEDTFMHHKFCVIDAEDLDLHKMFLGSLNLTLQGCVNNFEFVIITNNSHMITSYKDEFDLLWKTFPDIYAYNF
jgi:phosphatidylserine/phosphatidylglycerophosphate/cardiolipin synthase-like enzyme